VYKRFLLGVARTRHRAGLSPGNRLRSREMIVNRK
jgi:hypothetical protein